MAIEISRGHPFSAEDLDEKLAQGAEQMAAQNGMAVVGRDGRKVMIAGMGVTGQITWDEKQITVKAEAAMAFPGIDDQIRGAIQSALDRLCGA